MLQVEPEREAIEALSHTDQVRMAGHALAGWTFHALAAGTWIAKRTGWFDHYGSSLVLCLDSVDRAGDNQRRHADDRR